MQNKSRAKWIGCICAIAVILLDQLTKYFAVQNLKPVGSAPFLPGILHFQWVTNYGAAWGNFAGNNWILLGLTGLLILFLLVAVFAKLVKDPVLCVLFLLFAGGGIGNLIDRIRFGYVVDFLSFSFMDFPVFNVADMCISLSAFVALIYVIFFQDRLSKKRARQKELSESEPETSQGTE